MSRITSLSRILLAYLFAGHLGALNLAAAPPTLTSLFPPSGQRGQTVTVTATGSWSRWPVRAWCDDSGVAIAAGKKAGSLDIKIAADALAVPRWIRLYDDEGASELRSFLIGGLPETNEQEPNDDPKAPQALKVSGMVVHGKLAKPGDVDGFAVPVKKGESLVVSVDAARTLRAPMDAVLQLVSPEGFVVAQNDDHYGMDPHLVYTAPKDGNYVARVFAFPATPDSSIRFAGGDKFAYRLMLTTGPFADFAMPLAVKRDKLTAVEIVGWNVQGLGPIQPAPIDHQRAAAAHPLLPQAPWLRIEPHPTALIADSTPITVPLQLPVTVSGRMAKPGPHVVPFEAKKGQKLTFEIEARELDSPLDPVLRLTDAKGKLVAEAQAKKLNTDPKLSATAPGDGVYRLEIRDLHDSAGPRHFYRLRALTATPDFALTVANDRFTLPAGKTLDIPITVERRNGFAGDVALTVDGLPANVQAAAATSKGSAKTAMLKLTAGPGRATGPLRIVGRSGDDVRVAETSGAQSTSHLWLTVVEK